MNTFQCTLKQIIPLLLSSVLLINCEKKPEVYVPPPIFDAVEFTQLVSFMGEHIDDIKEDIPGEFYFKETVQGEVRLFYEQSPRNVNTQDTLTFVYGFLNDSLDAVGFFAPYRNFPMEVTCEMTICAVKELGEGKYYLKYKDKQSDEDILKIFGTEEELWDCIKFNDISDSDIVFALSNWLIGEYDVVIEYVGQDFNYFDGWINRIKN